MKLSIVIVNWNVRDQLRDCLRSVERETAIPREEYEVHVFDNASSDGSVEMVRAEFPDVILTACGDNLGFGRANNRAFGSCRGEYILLLNPDTVVLGHAVDSMLADMEANPDIGIMGCVQLNTDGSFQRAMGGAFPTLANVAWNYLFINRLLPGPLAPPALFLERAPEGLCDLDWVAGSCMMIRPEALGGRLFDESFFMFGEDMELCDRVRKAGWRVACSDSASITHHHGSSCGKQTRADVLETAVKGPRRFFMRTHGRAARVVYDLTLLIGYLVRWPGFMVASVVRPGRGYGRMSAASRRYAGVMLRALFE